MITHKHVFLLKNAIDKHGLRKRIFLCQFADVYISLLKFPLINLFTFKYPGGGGDNATRLSVKSGYTFISFTYNKINVL